MKSNLPTTDLMPLAMIIAGECTMVFLQCGYFVHVVAGVGEPGEIILDFVQWEMAPPITLLCDVFEGMLGHFPSETAVHLWLPRIGTACRPTALPRTTTRTNKGTPQEASCCKT